MTHPLRTLTVLVPRPGTAAASVIAPASGIVADPTREPGAPDILVYYEGNRYDYENLRRFSERVLHAAGRLVQRYPTVARGVFPRSDFDEVGVLHLTEDWQTHELHLSDLVVLAAWLPAD